ncbi:hypothetical protein TNCV_4597601 [Trichonephila clavipes]|nr:hypothetical protein TNCV_4597601 [Trichonephila clavipes]
MIPMMFSLPMGCTLATNTLGPWLEYRTPNQRALVRCSMPPNILQGHMEHVLAKLVGTKVLWAVATESMDAGGWRIFPSPLVPA